MGKRGPRRAINSLLRYRKGYPQPGPMETWLITHDLGTTEEIAASSALATIAFARAQDNALNVARADVRRLLDVAWMLHSALDEHDPEFDVLEDTAEMLNELTAKYPGEPR